MRRTVWVLVLVGALLGLASCAGDDGVEGVAVSTSEMKFSPASLRLKAGSHKVVVRNDGDLKHTFSLNELGQEVTVAPGETKTLSVDLAVGSYEYVCRILDHEGLGMHGVLRVDG